MSTILRSLAIIGLVIFGVLFTITFVSSKAIEESAKGFVKLQIEKEVRDRQVAMSKSDVVSKAKNLAEKFGLETHKIEKDLADDLPEKIASVICNSSDLI